MLSVSWNEYPLRQFHYTINDFHAFMQHVRTRFYEAAGDSTGSALPGKSWHDRSLTISFFSDKTNGSFALYEQLESVVSAMKGQARQEDSTLQKIKKFEAITTGLAESQEELAEKYFADAPPVAVITILGSFENTVRQICYDILLHCYKTK